MSSDEDFDDAAYKEFEDQLYQEESLSGSEDDLDSETEEALYSRIHYASSLLVSQSSTTTGNQRTPKKANLNDDSFQAKGQWSCHKDNSVIEISSDNDDDDDDDDDDDIGSNNDMDVDSVEDVKDCSNSLKYPEVLNIFSDESNLTTVDPEMALAQSMEEPGEIIENWDLSGRDLEDPMQVTKQRPRYYTPGKGLPHVRCYNCNEKGHLSQFCPEPKKISVCFLCGVAGHVKRNCPNELCFNCYEPGHMSKKCKKPRMRPFDHCKRCHVQGHLANDCPDLWRQYHLTTEAGAIICPDRPVSPPRSVYCYNCGLQGHYGHECQEETLLRKGELPLPFVVRYDSCHAPSSRGINNDHKRKETRRSKNEWQHQRESERFYDQDFDRDRRSFQPSPEKIQRLNDDDNTRRVSFGDDSYQTSGFNASYRDYILPKRKNKKKHKKREQTAGRTERTVELFDPSPPEEGLNEEPYHSKGKKNKKRKQWQREDSFHDNSYNNNFTSRKKFKHNDRGYANPHHKKDFRTFENRDFDARRNSFNPKKDRKNFVSNRGFQFNNQTHGKKSNPQFFKRYSF